MTVFCTSKPKPGPSGRTYDISPAIEYGEIRFIFDAYETPSTNPELYLNKARTILENFDPETDYIIAAGGDPYGLFLVGFVMNELDLPLKWLKFERLRLRPTADPAQQNSAGYYVPVEMPASVYAY